MTNTEEGVPLSKLCCEGCPFAEKSLRTGNLRHDRCLLNNLPTNEKRALRHQSPQKRIERCREKAGGIVVPPRYGIS